MKTFSQWVCAGIKEKLGIISPSKYYYSKKYRDKMDNSKLKFIPDWLIYWLIGLVIIILMVITYV